MRITRMDSDRMWQLMKKSNPQHQPADKTDQQLHAGMSQSDDHRQEATKDRRERNKGAKDAQQYNRFECKRRFGRTGIITQHERRKREYQHQSETVRHRK